MSAEALTRALLLRAQNDAYGRVLAHPYFNDIAVILERKALTSAEIAKLLGTVKGRSGKVGAAILVQRPYYFPSADDASARGQLVQVFTALEHPTLNTSSIGTGKTAEEIALELLRLFHFCAATVPTQVYSALPAGAVLPDDSFEGINAWATRVQMFADLGRPDRCGVPLISPDEGAAPQTITLTCATPGASIYYTVDGDSFPSSANTPAATLYTVPFQLAAAATVRATAQKSGMQQSGMAEATFT